MIIKIKNFIRLLIWKCKLAKTQLQKKFKHASDFGIIGNYDTINAKAFEKAIIRHLLDKDTLLIQGTYRDAPVNHYFNQTTRVNVMCKDKKFLSGWKLSRMQQTHVLTSGSL